MLDFFDKEMCECYQWKEMPVYNTAYVPCRKLYMKRNNIEYRFLFDGRSLGGWCMAGLKTTHAESVFHKYGTDYA